MTEPSVNALMRGAQMKINRANQHINELNTKINGFLAERPFQFVIKHEPQRSQYTLVSKRRKLIPNELPLIVGDAIHNLCSALDHIVYSMAADKAPQPFELMFPFVRKPESLESRINSTQVKFAGTYVVEKIRELKPYPGGNEILSGIHRLDNRDKHRLLILTAHAADLSPQILNAFFPGSPVAKMLGPSQVARFMHSEGDETLIMEVQGVNYARYFPNISTSLEQVAELQPPYLVTFGEGQPFEVQPVIPILKKCVSFVEQIVLDLLGAFLNPKNIR